MLNRKGKLRVGNIDSLLACIFLHKSPGNDISRPQAIAAAEELADYANNNNLARPLTQIEKVLVSEFASIND
jgi:hypothetical protein